MKTQAPVLATIFLPLFLATAQTSSFGQSAKFKDIEQFVKKTDLDSTLTRGEPVDYKDPVFDKIKIDGIIVPQFASKELRKVTLFDFRKDIEEEWQFYYSANNLVYYDHFVFEFRKQTNRIYEHGKALQGEKYFFDDLAIIYSERKEGNLWAVRELPDTEKQKLQSDIVRTSDVLRQFLKRK